MLDGVSWSATAGGEADVKPCPKGAIGMSNKICKEQKFNMVKGAF